MKKAAATALLWVMLLSLTACGVTPQPPETSQPSLPPSTQAPTADPTEPPTEAPTTAPSEAPEPEDSDLVRVQRYIPEIRMFLAYATENNFTGQIIYGFTDAYLRYGTVKKLELVCRELARQGLGLLIWDAFRPVSAQETLWEICPDPAYVSHPVTGSRSHCRGSAVDVTLIDLETGEELEMPTGFDDFTAQADRDYSDCTAEAAANAKLLEETMEKYGFKPYSAEWWHFADTDEYPVDETFEPGVG